MHLVIIGATGLIGSQLLKESFSEASIDKITIITRRSLELESDKLVQVVLEKMDSDSIKALNLTGDVFLCALGTTIKVAGSKEAFYKVDHDLVVAFAELAKKSEAKSLIIVSAMGANAKSSIFYNKVKGQMEESVKNLGLSSIYFLHPSLLIGDRAEKRIGEEIGIAFYKVISKITPKALYAKLGTKVPDIIKLILNEINSPKPGVNNIKQFC